MYLTNCIGGGAIEYVKICPLPDLNLMDEIERSGLSGMIEQILSGCERMRGRVSRFCEKFVV